jgi:hypothetical protein
MDKNILLNNYLIGSTILQNKMKEITNEMLLFNPNIVESWSIKEHVMHVVDSDINCSIYIKAILAQPKSTVFKIDGNAWNQYLGKKNIDINKYIQIFKLTREMIYDILIDEDESKLNRDYIVLPYNGKFVNMNIEECLNAFIKHLQFHLGYIDRNISEYKKI